MKTCILIEYYYPILSGGELFAQKIAEYCARKGADITVITALRPGLAELEVVNNVHIHRVSNYKVPYFLFRTYLYQAYLKFRALDIEQNFDLVHGHFPIVGGVPTYLTKKFAGKKTVLTTQGGDFLDYPDRSGFPFLLYKPFLHRIARSMDIMHAVSRYTADLSWGYGAQDVRMIPNGVDTTLFSPHGEEATGYEQYRPLVLTTSRLVPKNGIEILIKAIARLKELYPQVGLLVAGWGELEETLRRLCVELGLAEQVHFLGLVPHDELPALYRTADIFARPSLQEGFGISFIEAMACGLPTVGTRTGGITDFITSGKNGLLTEPGDVESLYQALKRLTEDMALRQQLSVQGSTMVNKEYSWETVGNRMWQLYQELSGS